MLTDRQKAQRNCGQSCGRVELCRLRSFRGGHWVDVTPVVAAFLWAGSTLRHGEVMCLTELLVMALLRLIED
jgi:hypothetical protein